MRRDLGPVLSQSLSFTFYRAHAAGEKERGAAKIVCTFRVRCLLISRASALLSPPARQESPSLSHSQSRRRVSGLRTPPERPQKHVAQQKRRTLRQTVRLSVTGRPFLITILPYANLVCTSIHFLYVLTCLESRCSVSRFLCFQGVLVVKQIQLTISSYYFYKNVQQNIERTHP
jgi:hypothetical protein